MIVYAKWNDVGFLLEPTEFFGNVDVALGRHSNGTGPSENRTREWPVERLGNGLAANIRMMSDNHRDTRTEQRREICQGVGMMEVNDVRRPPCRGDVPRCDRLRP